MRAAAATVRRQEQTRRRQPVYQRHPDEIDAWLITEEHGEDDGRTAAPPGKHHLRLR